MSEQHDEKLKSVSLSPTVTSLLKPTADLLGAELKDFIDAKIKSAKAKKKAENLKSHLEAACDSLSDATKEPAQDLGFGQLDLFSDWVSCSENVDPEDKEISEMWRNLLVDMTRKKPGVSIVLEKMKMLSPEDARTLIKLAGGASGSLLTVEDRYRIKRLQQIELVETREAGLMLINSLVVIGALAIPFLFVMAVAPSLLGNSFGKSTSADGSIYLAGSGLAFVAGYLLIVGGLLYRMKQRGTLTKLTKRLTWIGDRIVSLGNK